MSLVMGFRLATNCSAIHFNPSREKVRKNIDIWIAYNTLKPLKLLARSLASLP